jgi:hypothetical protein
MKMPTVPGGPRNTGQVASLRLCRRDQATPHNTTTIAHRFHSGQTSHKVDNLKFCLRHAASVLSADGVTQALDEARVFASAAGMHLSLAFCVAVPSSRSII